MAKRQSIDYAGLIKNDFWTNHFYNKAYDVVKDRKWPIVIPSYNRPDNLFIKWANNFMTEEKNYPIIFVVRKSQEEMYKNAEYIKGKSWISILAFEDDKIDDIGKVRKAIVAELHNKYPIIFMSDDDVSTICHSIYRLMESGSEKSQAIRIADGSQVMAMWQIGMEYGMKKYNMVMSSGLTQGFSFMKPFSDVETSICLMKGLPTNICCLDIQTIFNNGINFGSIKQVGHDDLDLLIKCLDKKLIVGSFQWLTYSTAPIGTTCFCFDTVQKRFTYQQQQMIQNHGDKAWVKAVNNRDLDNIGINWKIVRQEYMDAGIIGKEKTDLFHDLWRNGILIREAKNNFEEITNG